MQILCSIIDIKLRIMTLSLIAMRNYFFYETHLIHRIRIWYKLNFSETRMSLRINMKY